MNYGYSQYVSMMSNNMELALHGLQIVTLEHYTELNLYGLMFYERDLVRKHATKMRTLDRSESFCSVLYNLHILSNYCYLNIGARTLFKKT
jgi:hypothetical protein